MSWVTRRFGALNWSRAALIPILLNIFFFSLRVALWPAADQVSLAHTSVA
jgi:hypothetical protein